MAEGRHNGVDNGRDATRTGSLERKVLSAGQESQADGGGCVYEGIVMKCDDEEVRVGGEQGVAEGAFFLYAPGRQTRPCRWLKRWPLPTRHNSQVVKAID